MSSEKPVVCERCGAFGAMDHGWIEGDCILPHRNHSTRLLDGTNICVHCTDRWEEWLEQLVELYTTLGQVVLAGSIPDTTANHGHTKKAPASPSPLRLDAWALIHTEQLQWAIRMDDGTMQHPGMTGLPDIPDVMANWASAVYEALGWGDGAPSHLSGSVAVLRANTSILAGLADVDTFDAEMRWVHRSLQRAHGLSNPKPIGQCLTVGCTGTVWPTATEPGCNKCGRHYCTPQEVARLGVNEDIRRRTA